MKVGRGTAVNRNDVMGTTQPHVKVGEKLLSAVTGLSGGWLAYVSLVTATRKLSHKEGIHL